MIPAPRPILSDTLRAAERHYSVAEVAEMWNLSKSAVRRLFQEEPGVLAIGESRPKFGRRRGKVTLRIQQSVLERVHRRLCIGA
jgi:predicted transcriptional regulator